MEELRHQTTAKEHMSDKKQRARGRTEITEASEMCSLRVQPALAGPRFPVEPSRASANRY